MDAAVGGVGGRAHRRRVGDPHRRRRRARGEQLRRVARGAREDVGVVPAKPSARSARTIGALVRRQHGLRDSRARRARASSRVPAAPPRADWRRCRALLLGREIAARESRVVVRRARDAVEVDSIATAHRSAAATERHRAHVSPSATPSAVARVGRASGKRSTRAGACDEDRAEILEAAVRDEPQRCRRSGCRAPDRPRRACTGSTCALAHRVDVVAKAFDRRARVEDVDVAFVAEAFLLEHRARGARVVVHLADRPRAPIRAAGSRTPDAAASARRRTISGRCRSGSRRSSIPSRRNAGRVLPRTGSCRRRRACRAARR